MLTLFKKSKQLEQEVERFLEIASQSGLIFQQGIADYFAKNEADFARHLQEIRELERGADDLRRDVETQLYVHTLIPESRGDVLAVLETTDNVTNHIKHVYMEFSIEKPEIYEEFQQDFSLLVSAVVKAVDSMVAATRAFFRDVNTVRDHLHKVYFHEKDADKLAERLKRRIFDSSAMARLSHKTQLSHFVRHIDNIADYSEDVADRLSIYSIKRTV